jgi:hypothetical protein
MRGRGWLLRQTLVSGKGNCRSLGSPGFPVESCGFGQLYVVLLRKTTYVVAGEAASRKSGYARDDRKGRVDERERAVAKGESR